MLHLFLCNDQFLNEPQKKVCFFFFFLFSPSSKHLSLFLFKYYSIIFLIKKRGISGHLVQMRTKNVRISLNRLVYAIWRLTKTVVKRQKSSKYDVYIFIFCMYGNCHTSFHHLEVALKAYWKGGGGSRLLKKSRQVKKRSYLWLCR